MIRRLTAVAIDFLIVAALASMHVTSLLDHGATALILMLVGAVWCVVTLVWLSPRLLRAITGSSWA